MRVATCCWLLVALIATTALAQTHPNKKYHRKPVAVHKQETEVPDLEALRRTCGLRTYSEPQQTTSDVKPDSTKVYTYVEQMPTLNGQPFAAASKAAIEQQLAVLLAAPDGRVFVSFEVTKAGSIRNVRILKSLRADVDSAVVTATRQLPRFTPGKQAGHAVVVRTVIFITIPVKK